MKLLSGLSILWMFMNFNRTADIFHAGEDKMYTEK